MDNSQMKPNRFYRWAEARRKHRLIIQHLQNGGKVVIATYTHATVYTRQHADMFKATQSGLYVRAGKRWDCLDFSNVRLTVLTLPRARRAVKQGLQPTHGQGLLYAGGELGRLT